MSRLERLLGLLALAFLSPLLALLYGLTCRDSRRAASLSESIKKLP